jgi:hypothetical protein
MAAGGDVSQIVLQMPDAAAQPMIDLCFGVASSASREESEEMHTGISSVPKISSGSKSRLEWTRKGKHKTAGEGKKQIRRRLTLEWCASLMKSCHP